MKGIDVGGLFNFIRNRPEDSEHTKEKRLWDSRFKNGMCPHCGQKVYKLRRVRLRKKFVPLSIQGKVDNGACIHPKCDPPKKTRPRRPQCETEDLSDDETVANDTDNILDAISEYREDMVRFYSKMKDSNKKARDAAALMLEETVVQLNRAMSELSAKEKEEIRRVREDLLGEIDTARDALKSVQMRVSNVEEVTKTLRRQLLELRDHSSRDRASLRAHVHALRAELGEVASGSDRDKDSLRNEVAAINSRLNRFQSENACLREENEALRQLLERKPEEKDDTSQDSEVSFGQQLDATYLPQLQTEQPIDVGQYRSTAKNSDSKYKCQQTLSGHQGAVTCCTVLDHGRKLVCGSHNSLFIWQCATSRQAMDYVCRQRLDRHSDRITCCASAEDNLQTLVSGSDDKTLVVWVQRKKDSYQYVETLRQHTDSVYCCALSGKGTTLVSGSKDATFLVWQRERSGSFSVLQSLDVHSMSVECCCLSQDGTTLVTGSSDETLKVFKRQRDKRYQRSQTLKKHRDSVMCCSMDESGTVIVSGSKDTSLIVWNQQHDGKFTHSSTLEEHTEWINCSEICDRGRLLISGSDDNTLRVWCRVSDGSYRCKQVLKKHRNYVYCCSSIGEGMKLVSGGNDATVKLWSLAS